MILVIGLGGVQIMYLKRFFEQKVYNKLIHIDLLETHMNISSFNKIILNESHLSIISSFQIHSRKLVTKNINPKKQI